MTENAPNPFAEVPVPSPRKEEESADSLGGYRRPDRPPILSPAQIRRLADDCLTLFQESKVVLEKRGIRATIATVDRSTLPGPDTSYPDPRA